VFFYLKRKEKNLLAGTPKAFGEVEMLKFT
jgi:hypothetical protein